MKKNKHNFDYSLLDLNICPNTIKKVAKRSWIKHWETGNSFFKDTFNSTSLIETPYICHKEQIEHLTNTIITLDIDDWRQPILEKQLTEVLLLFIFRYEWEFNKKAPFEYRWIFDQYCEYKKNPIVLNYIK